MSRHGQPETIAFRTREEQQAAIERVVRHLAEDGLIAYPTETVYGFGCTLRPAALARLAAAKNRSGDKPFLLLVTDRHMVPGVVWTAAAIDLADAFWPGPLTLALEVAASSLPAAVVSQAGTVALRATPHAGIRLLLDRIGGPLTSTSANEPGAPPASNGGDAGRALARAAGDWPILVLDGGTLPASRPSTIVDCSTVRPRIVRAGAIGESELAERIDGSQTTRP